MFFLLFFYQYLDYLQKNIYNSEAKHTLNRLDQAKISRYVFAQFGRIIAILWKSQMICNRARHNLKLFCQCCMGAVLYAITSVFGQTPVSPYYDNDFFSPVIEYCVNRETIRLPFVLQQPCQSRDLLYSLAGQIKANPNSRTSRWLRLVMQDLLRFYRPLPEAADKGMWQLGASGFYRGFSQQRQWTQYRAELYGSYNLPYLVLANKTVTDQAFKYDPLFYGDTGEWIYGRVENAYALLRYKALDFFAGRINRNMGPLGEKSLIWSDNPFSYDHVGLQLSAGRFRFTMYVSRLNDMTASENGKIETTALCRRYMTLHRGDFHLSDRLQIGFSEAAIYGGADRNFEFFYLNPMNLFYIDQRNQGSQMSGLWAVDLFYKPSRASSFYLQYLIDDVVVNNEPGQDDRSRYPDRMGLTAKASVADLWPPASQWSLTYTRIGNWTYISRRSWENYIYQSKGLGYPANSLETWRLDLRWFGLPPLLPQVQAGFEQRGQQSLTTWFPATRDKFPIGIVEKITYIQFSLQYFPTTHCQALFQVRHNIIENENHVIKAWQGRTQFSLVLYANLHTHVVF